MKTHKNVKDCVKILEDNSITLLIGGMGKYPKRETFPNRRLIDSKWAFKKNKYGQLRVFPVEQRYKKIQ